MHFFVGLHQLSDAPHFNSCFVSINRLRGRKKFNPMRYWIMDSGAFTTVNKYGEYPEPPEVYANEIMSWQSRGTMLAAVSQDYMCEPFVLERTGLTIADHQKLTVERYDAIKRVVTSCYILPVLQGYAPEDYVSHIRQYDGRLPMCAWVGVGSICKRNGKPEAVREVLQAIKLERPDLRLHGFGLKLTALADRGVRALLWSADSMAWSFSARRQGRNANDWREAERFRQKVTFGRVIDDPFAAVEDTCAT